MHSFATSPGASDGANPTAGLIADQLGDLYGTTQGGGIGSGVAFALTPAAGSAWNETVLHAFGMAPGATDGAHPAGGLLFGPGNALYGTAMSGGSGNAGVAFELSFGGTGWTETVLHAFGTTAGSADGATPIAGLTSDASGNLYGTTFAGGVKYGVIYKLAVPPSGHPGSKPCFTNSRRRPVTARTRSPVCWCRTVSFTARLREEVMGTALSLCIRLATAAFPKFIAQN